MRRFERLKQAGTVEVPLCFRLRCQRMRETPK